MTFEPNGYWYSIVGMAALIYALTLIGVLVIRIVARAAERRVARLTLTPLIGRDPLTSADRGDAGNQSSDGAYSHDVGGELSEGRATYPTVPVTVWELPPFARRRRHGESFTDFAHRLGLS